MRFAAIGIAVNIVGSLALFFWIGHVGIALATSAAAWVNAILLGVRLVRLGHFKFDARLKSRLPRLGLSAAIMGAGLWGGTVLAAPLLTGSSVEGVAALALLVGGGGLLFGIAILATGAAKASDLKNAFRRA